jgi:hypothetical protein
MEAPDKELLNVWVDRWNDLMDFPCRSFFPVMEFYTNCGAGFSACGLAFQRVQPAGRPACGHDWPPHNKCRMTVSEKRAALALTSVDFWSKNPPQPVIE